MKTKSNNNIERTPLIMETTHSTCRRLMPKKKKILLNRVITIVKLNIGQPVIITSHAHHTIKIKYLLDYKVLKYLMTAHSWS